MGFPVLRLPSVTFDNVYKFLDIPDKILLSQCSRSMKAIVKSKERSRENMELELHISKYFSAYLNESRRSHLAFNWYIETNENPQPGVNKEVISNDGAMIGNVGITMREAKNKWMSLVKRNYFEKKILAIIKVLQEVFSCPVADVYFTWRYKHSFKKLIVDTDVLHHAPAISIHNSTSTPEQMTFMLDHFTSSYLEIDADAGVDYSYQNPLRQYQKLHLRHARWVNLEKLLTLSETAISLVLKHAVLITEKDLNQFIKWWIRSDNKELKVVYIERSNGERDRAAIMEGIESTPGRKKRTEAIPLCLQVDDRYYENGLDICRNDGAQATVIVDNLWFLLGVMQLSNPNLEEITDN